MVVDPQRTPRTLSRQGVTVGDDWTQLSFWNGRRITFWVSTATIEVELAAEQPPNPPSWAGSIFITPGAFSREVPFGYFRFRNATAGRIAIVNFSASD